MITREVATRCVAWALVLGCLATIAAMLLVGARAASYDDLVSAVQDGRVDEIRVAGGLPDGHGRGSAVAEVHWRDRWVPRVTEVYESTVKQRGSSWSMTWSDDVPTVRGRVDEELRQMDPDLRTTRSGEAGGVGEFGFRITFGSPPVSGWQLPGWTLMVGLATFIGALWLLIRGPEPHRATRWAWFWLLGLAAPVGTLAFLFLSGATSFRPTPARTEGRLTGGWAFLLSFLIGSAVATSGSVVL
ncbi:hypothetical protein [Nocardioides sp. SR21]|uniref:hypothetical protein n=1 Tax=Nocardioides sp. SR21 TaxID=2919501 RepID=UPI001FAB0C34|nr:hypothetical protein [Nocardioides sp. SR21]